MNLHNNLSNEEVKEKIIEQDEAKLKFKRKLSNLKSKYGIEFDIDLLEDNSIDKIKFYDLKYKNQATEVNLIFYNEHNYFGAYVYNVSKNKTLLQEDYLTKKNYFNKEYKLEMIINEIRQYNELYKVKLYEIEIKYQGKVESDLGLSKELKIESSNKNT